MESKNIKLSIIIPVYNVEKYVEKCLKSVCDLKVKNEIIVVNDGSLDKSLEIVKKFKEEHNDKNIKILNQKNSGVSVARNTGLKEAKGEFVFFLDSDDWVETESFNRVLEENIDKKQESDVIVGREIRYDENGGKKWTGADANTPKNLVGKILTGREYLKKAIEHKFLSARIGVYLYNREFLKKNNIQFLSQIKSYEDELFAINVLSKTKKIKIIDGIFGIYLSREGSITHSADITQVENLFESCKYLIQKYGNENDELIKKIVFYRIKRFYKRAMKESLEYNEKNLFYKIYSEFKKDFKKELRYTKIKKFENINFYVLYFLGKYFFIKELIKNKN